MNTTSGGSNPPAPTGLLEGVTVVDFGVGMPAALTAKFLVEMGAKVYRVPPAGGDPFYDVYPAYRIWRHEQILTEAAAHSAELQEALLRDADICILGGEDYPGLNVRRDALELSAKHGRLIVLSITAEPGANDSEPLRGVDILVQARTGMLFEISDERPVLMSFQPSAYGAMLQGLAGVGAALIERERSGHGQVVAVSLVEGTLSWVQPMWSVAEKTTPKFEFVPPKQARPIILKCRSGDYVHVVLGGVGSKYRLYKVLGIDDPDIGVNDPGLPDLKKPPGMFFGDIDLLAQYVIGRDRDELLRALWEAEIVAEPVLAPGECWDDPQAQYNGAVRTSPDGLRYVAHPTRWSASPAERPTLAPSQGRPLSGIKVLDFGAFVAGPTASVALADLGADVIKVELPEGDPMRAVHRYFSASNRGKRSIAIDMKTPEGMEITRRLCARADVVSSNFRAGVAARLGIDAANLHPQCPGTIVLNNAGYGVGGPKARNPAFDPAMQAVCGHEVRAGGEGNAPLFNRFNPVDFCGALLGTVAVTMALYRRVRHGSGAELTIPLLNAGIFLLSELIRTPDGELTAGRPLDRGQTGFHPAEKIYRTRDGWIAICARNEQSARSLAKALSVGQLIHRPRSEWGEGESAALAQSIRAQSTQDVLRKLQQADVWCEICRTGGSSTLLGSEALLTRGTLYHTLHPDYGMVRGIGPLFTMSKSRVVACGETPLKGQHTRAILTELGYTAGEVNSLYERKIVA